MAKSPARKTSPNRAWFEKKIVDSAYTQTEIATRIGINKAGFSRMLSGDQQMTTEAASVLANLFDESIVEVLRQADALSPGVSAARLEALIGGKAPAGEVVGERKATVYRHPSLGEISKDEDEEHRRLPRTDIVGWIDDAGRIHSRGVDSPRRISSPIRLPAETVGYRFQTSDQWDRWVIYVAIDPEADGVPTAALGQLCVVRGILSNNESNKPVTMLRHLLRKKNEKNYIVKAISSNVENEKATSMLLKNAFPVLWMRQR